MRGSPHVHPSTRNRVLEAVDKLGYHPHAAAAALRSARSNTIGFLAHRYAGDETLSEIDVFRNRVFHAIAGTAEENGRYVLQSGFVDARKCKELIASCRIDGLLVDMLVPDSVVHEIRSIGAPMVVVGRSVDDPAVSWIKADEEDGAWQATRHLIDQGHTTIGLLTAGGSGHPVTVERTAGYRRALREHDLPERDEWRCEGDWTFDSGYRLSSGLLGGGNSPTALFALNEMMAVGCLHAAADSGVRVPDDFAIATVEDSPWARYVRPALTAVHTPMYDVGREATQVLLRQLDGDDAVTQLTLPTTLNVRESTRKVRSPEPSGQ